MANGIQKKLHPSEALADVLGSSAPISRGQVMKKVWAYIKANDLSEGRTIHPDETLAQVTGKSALSMFKLPGKLSAHLSND